VATAFFRVIPAVNRYRLCGGYHPLSFPPERTKRIHVHNHEYVGKSCKRHMNGELTSCLASTQGIVSVKKPAV
jgi:hypothetical protein